MSRGLCSLILITGAMVVCANTSPDEITRECVRQADSSAALAQCESLAHKRWQARLSNNDQRLRFNLDDELRALYIASHSAWESYRDAEFALLDATLNRRSDGLAGILAQGAKTEVIRRRTEQQESLLKALPIKQTR